MMKKTLSLLLCVVLLCSMAACATKDHDHNNMNRQDYLQRESVRE